MLETLSRFGELKAVSRSNGLPSGLVETAHGIRLMGGRVKVGTWYLFPVTFYLPLNCRLFCYLPLIIPRFPPYFWKKGRQFFGRLIAKSRFVKICNAFMDSYL
jgi:hypothetical protein